jgi:hypothetical protein
VPIDRRIDGKLALERAVEAGALENLRALEELGARPRPTPEPPKPPKPRPSKAPTRSRGLGPPVRASLALRAPTPAKRWWDAPVRPKHFAMLFGVVGTLASSIALGHPAVGLAGFGVLIVLGLVGLRIKIASPPRARRGRWDREDG